ncbi:class I SAM-dependent methyltransferase [Phenylobacterium sp.]|uniref:class I SAM-dependent methyltransferase n=1 Tax=Phenylobacterium sp. TaxID=1871053 RepID=UPI0035B22F7E
MQDHPNAFYDGGLSVATYDLFAAGGALEGDVAFYLSLAERTGGPVLELGAGSGRVLLALARAGLKMTGVDLSAAMLAIARARLEAEGLDAELVQAPMQDFEADGRFALALIPARAFQHLVEPADQRVCLERVRRSLRPGGLLAVDLFDPLLEAVVGEPAPAPAREAADPATGRRFRRRSIGRWTDPLRQLVGERLRLEALGDDGRVIEAQETSWALRWNTRQEMAWLLELCGFAVEAQYSDFRGAPPAYGKEQLWVARAV